MAGSKISPPRLGKRHSTTGDTVFRQRVLAVVAQIPRGDVMTYKEVADAAGYPGAYRAVGSALKSNFDETIPCHRVIRSDGRLGHYNRGDTQKRRLLQQEGIRL